MSDHPVQTGDPEGFDSVAIWMQERLGKWAAFADDIMSWEGITVLDGQLHHECVDSLLYYDVPPVDIEAFITRLEDSVEAAHPILIYLHQRDAARRSAGLRLER